MASETQIKHMANRFLQWKLPKGFSPDGGVTFDPIMNAGTPHELRREPTGTNLLNALQAEDMVRFMVEGLQKGETHPLPRASELQADKAIAELKKAINAAENANQAGEDMVVLMARAPQLYWRVIELEELLNRAAEFADKYVDVNDGDYGEPEPNEAMRLVSAIREELPVA